MIHQIFRILNNIYGEDLLAEVNCSEEAALALVCMVIIMQVKGKNMAALVFLLSLVLYSAAPVHPHPQGVVHREADITNSRQAVSLGGLFIFRYYNEFGRCSEVICPQRAEAMVFAIRQKTVTLISYQV